MAFVCAGFNYPSFDHLDDLLSTLIQYEFETGVVLGDAHSETILRRSKKIHQAELVFDVAGEGVTLFSNIRAAAAATDQEFFAVSIEQSHAGCEAVYRELLNAYYREGFRTPLHAFCSESSLPVLITRTGNQLIRKTPDIASLRDSRLSVETLGSLATIGNSL